MPLNTTRGSDVTRPAVSPLKSSVLDHATVVDLGRDFSLRNNEGLWPSYNCLDLWNDTVVCPAPIEAKVFEVAPWVPAFEFVVYGGVQCHAVGLDVEDQKRETERVFKASEGIGVERALLSDRFVPRVADPDRLLTDQGTWPAPVDVTPGVAVPLPVAFALLEGYAATAYRGQPTIHMSRAAASLLGSDKIVWEGDKAFSRMGSKIAVGGGYDDPTPPMTGEWTMHATGEVYVERSAEVRESAYGLPGGGQVGGVEENAHITLVERAYRVGVDCFVARATGTVWA